MQRVYRYKHFFDIFKNVVDHKKKERERKRKSIEGVESLYHLELQSFFSIITTYYV